MRVRQTKGSGRSISGNIRKWHKQIPKCDTAQLILKTTSHLDFWLQQLFDWSARFKGRKIWQIQKIYVNSKYVIQKEFPVRNIEAKLLETRWKLAQVGDYLQVNMGKIMRSEIMVAALGMGKWGRTEEIQR